MVWKEYERDEENREYLYDPRFEHTLFLLELQKAGYPFKGNQLTLDEWLWITELKTAIEEFQIEKVNRNVR